MDHTTKTTNKSIHVQQIKYCEPKGRVYLWDAIENSSANPLIYRPVDSSIYR